MRYRKAYNRLQAVEYARKWAFSRNPIFYDFSDLGGNCTNFVSQCILAGCGLMNPTPTYGWYYYSPDDRTPSWTGVEYFYDYLTGRNGTRLKNGGIGPYGDEVPREALRPGDVVQLQNGNGVWYHSLLVTGFSEEGVLVAAQSVDAFDRPLSTYRYAADRFLHLRGTVGDTEENGWFGFLMRGLSENP